jgi:nitrogen regulatory protein PII
MKQIKAFMHPHCAPAVIDALRDSGLCDISAGTGCHHLTVSTVQRLYTSADPQRQHYSLAITEPVVDELKLELICDDELAEQLRQIIVQASRSGTGWVFVSDIQSATQLV